MASVLLASTAVIGAQSPARPESAVAHKTYVLTGCLVVTGAAPASVFELRDAVAVGQAPPASTSAEPKPTATSGEKLAFRLKPESAVGEPGVREEQLKMHAGQRVQVTVHEPDAVAPPPARTGQQASAAPPAQSSPQDYTVTEIKTVSNSCL
jgi:hypothetical protein